MIDGLKPYPKMKDSGVPWLGEVPEHWNVRRLKRICRLTYGDALAAEARHGSEVAVYGSNGRVGFHSVPNTMAPCLVIGRKGSFGKVNFSSEPVFAIDTTFVVDSRTSSADIRWLYFLLGWLRLDAISKDSAVPGLDREDAYQRVAPLPPLPEQAAIVRFLDHADRRIRRYIRSRQKLIKLLEEQKQAIIHRAVTRGLDPEVRLKPSGVEWLGEVPEHWEIWQIGHFASVGNGSTPSRSNLSYWVGGEYPWLNSSSANASPITASSQFVTTTALRECHLPRVRAGSVLVAITGQGKTRGKAAILAVEATINQHIAFITPRKPNAVATSEYLQQFLVAAYSELRRLSDDSGSTKGALTCADLRHFRATVPPIAEQREVVKYVTEATAEIEKTAQLAACEIDLLREYRTRLIADVVTGKLDVREAAARLTDKTEDTDSLDDFETESVDEEAAADSPEEALEDSEA